MIPVLLLIGDKKNGFIVGGGPTYFYSELGLSLLRLRLTLPFTDLISSHIALGLPLLTRKQMFDYQTYITERTPSSFYHLQFSRYIAVSFSLVIENTKVSLHTETSNRECETGAYKKKRIRDRMELLLWKEWIHC